MSVRESEFCYEIEVVDEKTSKLQLIWIQSCD